MPSRREPIWTGNFIAVSFVNLFVFLSFQMIFPTLPLYVKSLGGSDAVIGLVMGIFTAATLIARPTAGILLDRIGKKKVLLCGLGVFTVMVYLYGMVSSIALIILVRLGHGLGWGLAGTSTATIAAEIIPKSRFAEGMGWFSLANGLSMAFAPALGIYLGGLCGLRSVFLIAAAIALVSFGIGFFIKCSHRKNARLSKRLKVEIYEKSVIPTAVLMFCLTFTFGSIISFLPLYAYSQGIKSIGVFFSVYAVVILITRPLVGKAVDRFGFDVAIIPGFMLLFVAIVILSAASVLQEFLLVAVIYGIGFGALQTTIQTMAVRDVPHYRLGAANATLFTGLDLGMGIGVIVLGLIADRWGYRNMYLFTLIPVVFSALFYLFYARRHRLPSSLLVGGGH